MSPFPAVVLMFVWIGDAPFKDPGHWEIDATYTEAKAKAEGFKSAAVECAYQMKIDTDDRRCVHYTPGKVVPLMDTSWMK
jgi:hypothetical protein